MRSSGRTRSSFIRARRDFASATTLPCRIANHGPLYCLTSSGIRGEMTLGVSLMWPLAWYSGDCDGSVAFRLESDEAVLVGDSRRLRAVLDPELPVDVREVELHRLLGDPELLADLLVRESTGERRQQRRLVLAEAEILARSPRRLDLAVDLERIAVGRCA